MTTFFVMKLQTSQREYFALLINPCLLNYMRFINNIYPPAYLCTKGF